MKENNSINMFQREPISQFIFDPEKNIFVHPDNNTIDYQDGGELYILESMKKITDLSSHSLEFQQYIKDWPSRYHFSPKRINFLEGIKEILPKNADVLEIGSGCGSITRWLGEQFHSVDALEGNVTRAGITRYRTKDQENVKVYCGNLLATDVDKKYDIITLIGSFEYLPLYDTNFEDPKDACSAILTRLRKALKDDGILLIAIENKFGAKYFSGCKEDHTEREFEGIIGYPDKTPVTFSRNEIESMLCKTGYSQNQFYHVFPDYKLTETIIPENQEVLSLYPHNWIRTPFEDYSGNRLNLFPDLLFLKSLVDSELLWQFSNSFVIIASNANQINLTVPWFIKCYRNFEDLDQKFHHEITLIKDPTSLHTEKKYCVVRSPRFSINHKTGHEKFQYNLNDNEYICGDLLINSFFIALFKKSPERELKLLLTDLHTHLVLTHSTGKTDSEGYHLITGDAIDYTFWNLIVGKNQELYCIDTKWTYNDLLAADLILFRNLFWIFEKVGPFLAIKDKRMFILEMIRSIYPQYSEERLTAALEFECIFQTYSCGKPQTINVSNSIQYSLADIILQNREMCNQIQSLNRVSIAKDTQLQEMTNQIQSLNQVSIAKDTQLQEMTNQIQSLSQVSIAKDTQLQEMTNQIQSLNQVSIAKDTQLQEMTNQIQSLNQVSIAKDTQLQEMTNQIQSLNQKISSIENSIVWQFTMKFHNKIIERIFPHNSQRRKYYDLGLNGGKILVNEGWDSFWWQFNERQSQKNQFSRKKRCISETIVTVQQISDTKIIDTTVSIIIPTKNAGPEFDYVLNKIRSQKGILSLEIVIIDSGSTDDTLEIAKKYLATVIQIKPEEFDHGKTRNLGAFHSNGEYILFTTQDALFAGDSLIYTMVSFFHNDNKIAAVTCRQVPRSDADLMACYQVWSHYYKFLNIDSDKVVSANNLKISPHEKRKLANLSDSCCCMKRELFLQYQYKVNFAEDLELGLRLLKDGHKLAYLYNAAIIHSHNRTAAYFFKANYTDSKIVSQILSNPPLNWSMDSIADFFATIEQIYSKLSYALTIVQQSNIQDPMAFIGCLEKEMQRENLSSDCLKSTDKTIDILFLDIERIIMYEMRDRKSDPRLSDILINNFINSLEAFGEYCKNYKSINGFNADFIATIFKLFASSTASPLGNYVLYIESQDKMDDVSNKLDIFLRTGV